ncbi:hypothetical protein ACLI4Q_06185 [Natrialbaceae archaeon A-CW1-1]
MLDSRVIRLLSLGFVLGALFGLFIFDGALEPAPEINDYPGTDDLEEAPTTLLDEQASVSALVVATDPITIQLENGDEYVVEGAPEANVGQELSVFVTIHEPATDTTPGTLEAHDGVARDQWETTYMYAVSIIAALWILVRSIRHWRLDSRRLVFVPAPSDVTTRKEIREEGEVDG